MGNVGIKVGHTGIKNGESSYWLLIMQGEMMGNAGINNGKYNNKK
jgi:hypothetical protein